MYGRDHIASPCAHEGDAFEEGANWWQPAVEVLPEAVEKAAEDLTTGRSGQGDIAVASQGQTGRRVLPAGMSVVNPESRAAPTRGAAFAYHRSSQLVEWLRRGNGVRLALSAARRSLRGADPPTGAVG